MRIEIPREVESLVQSQARAAGFSDVTDYVLSLVHQDQLCRQSAESTARDPRIETLAAEGIESGPPISLDMESIRREYRQRVGKSA